MTTAPISVMKSRRFIAVLPRMSRSDGQGPKVEYPNWAKPEVEERPALVRSFLNSGDSSVRDIRNVPRSDIASVH
jgi:hypothetical protein